MTNNYQAMICRTALVSESPTGAKIITLHNFIFPDYVIMFTLQSWFQIISGYVIILCFCRADVGLHFLIVFKLIYPLLS